MSFFVSRQKLVGFFFLFMVFDILFLPNFIMSTPISFFICLIGANYFFCFRWKDLTIYLGLLCILLSSVFFGFLSCNEDLTDNLKRAFQLSLILSLVFFNYHLIDYSKLKNNVFLIIISFVFYLLFLAFVFLVEPEIYNNYIGLIYPESKEMLDVNFMSMRFSYKFTDPNSLAYLLVLILAFILSIDVTFNKKFLFVSCIALLIALTQSRGGLLGFFLVVIIHFFLVVKINLKFIFSVVFVVFFLALITYFFYDYIESYHGSLQARRQIEVSMGSPVGGVRLDNWLYFISNFNFYPFGTGYQLYKDGAIFRPHSDFIRLNFSYGLFSIVLLFSLFKNYSKVFYGLWVAFLIPFTINTLIDDYRLFGFFILAYIFLLRKKSF